MVRRGLPLVWVALCLLAAGCSSPASDPTPHKTALVRAQRGADRLVVQCHWFAQQGFPAMQKDYEARLAGHPEGQN